MKVKLFFLFIVFCVSISNAESNKKLEISEVTISTPGLTSASLEIYTLIGNTATYIDGGTITNGIGRFDVKTVEPYYANPCIANNPLDDVIAENGVYLVVNGVFLSWYWERGGGDYEFTYSSGTLTNIKTGESSSKNWINSVTVNGNVTGGQFTLFGANHDFGSTVTPVYGGAFPTTVSVAYVQTDNNGNRKLLYEWDNNVKTTSRYLGEAGNWNVTASYDPAINLTFSGSNVSVTSCKGVTSSVNANQQYEAASGRPLTITAVDQYSSTFYASVSWSTGETGSTINYTPSSSGSITVTPIKQASVNFRNLSFKNPDGTSGPTAGQYITLVWSVYNDPAVTGYEIWRIVKNVQSSTLIASISGRTTHIYTDYDCVYTDSYTQDLIYYDVKATMTSPNLNAETLNAAVYGDFAQASMAASKNCKEMKSLNTDTQSLSLGSYPNPFNPTTVIRYSMPEAGQVSLKVYNILSQEVANLVESNQSAGVHQVNFNASHLPTGIYIARLQAGAKVMTTKLQLVK
jgi:hypothetical protein